MKTFLKIVLTVCLLLVVTPFAALAAWSYGSSSVYEVKSPSNLGSAILYQESGFLDITMDLCIRDYAASGTKPISVAFVSDISGQGTPPELVVWSGDGTVVAVRCGKDWTYCYDFRYHKSGPPLGMEGKQRSQFVQALLNARGFVGQVMLSNKIDFDAVSRHVWPWESFPYA